MRPLQYNNDGGFILTEFLESDTPKYAVISHRWGAEEVTFRDLMDATSKSKTGYARAYYASISQLLLKRGGAGR